MPKGNHSNHRKSSGHYRWSAGSKLASNGYVKVRVGVGHPLADPNGMAYEHLLVWVAAGNQRPNDKQIIHHINEDKTDNRIANLRLMLRSDHSQMHGNAISDAAVKSIREEYASGLGDMQSLAAKYGISLARVSRIVRGESRKSAGGPTSTSNRGKKAAGRTLDGRTWDEFPQVAGVRP